MLKPAQLYIPELKSLFWETAYDLKYQYANDGYTNNYIPSTSTWNKHEFVSISSEDNLLGYIKYYIDQRANKAHGFFAINFSYNKMVFGRDLVQVIDDIFQKYRINKLSYGVHIGNAIEKTYDRLTRKYGGRIVGVSHMDAKLLNGEYVDYKSYELFRSDYIMSKKKVDRQIKRIEME